ncbi:MAG: xylulokinase [Clostridiales bacterium]|jgi:xylulokinase|nr:xylulokinase [Clostridiales bacterium]
MASFLGIDVGTSGTKVILMAEDGRILCSRSSGYDVDMPRNGWAEQHPDIWWKGTLEAIQGVLADPSCDKNDIKALGLTGQMHGLVALDKAGTVIRPALLWCDQRTAKQCDEITETVGAERLIKLTSNPALTGFTSPKILWVRENEPENYKKFAAVMLPKDYIRYKLTGDNAGDVSDASGTGLLNVAGRAWSQEVLDKLDINKDWLGKLYESCEVTGTVSGEAAAATGLPKGLPVVAGAGDNAAAAIGTGVARDGSAFVTIGSSGVVFAHATSMTTDPKGRVHTFCSAVPGEWHIMGVILSAGMSLQWFRNNATGGATYAVLDAEAEKSPVGCNRLIFLPYLNGERTPHKDPDSRGVFFGLSSMHTRGDLARAVMEGVSYALKDSLDIINEMGVTVATMTACGGGGGSPFWRKMLADVFGVAVNTVQSQEGPALGAAILAGVGAGTYPSVPEACDILIKSGNDIKPDLAATRAYAGYHRLYKELYGALAGSYKKLAAL